jgi:hypothetical protein
MAIGRPDAILDSLHREKTNIFWGHSANDRLQFVLHREGVYYAAIFRA